MRWLILLIGTVFMLAGCGAIDPMIDDQQAGHNDPRHVKNHQGNTFIEGDNTDIADLNPNFLNTDPNEAAGSENIGYYRQKLRDQVTASKKFEPRVVNINGNRATVHVRSKGSYSKKDVKQLKSELQKAVPRYNIRVDVD